MSKLLTLSIPFNAFFILNATHNAKAKTHSSFYFGEEPTPYPYYEAPTYYVTPPYYLAPVAPRCVVPHYYVTPQQYCYQVYEYTPFGRVSHMECY